MGHPAGSSGGLPHYPFDPELAAYDILRRLVCKRFPFDELSFEQTLIPDDLRKQIEFGCLVSQVSVYVDAAQRKFGNGVSERIRTHLLLLAGFDPELKAGLQKFLEAIRGADAEFAAGHFSDIFEGASQDLTRYYATLAIMLLIASGCPEERQRALAGSIGERLLAARFRADDVFEAELTSAKEVSVTFQWSTEPGPFERQLQLQQNNPLFPATVRVVSTQQVKDARLADLKRMSDFMSTYRPIVKDGLSPPANMVVKEASDLEKRMIDLIPSCMVLGNYFSKELKFLADVSDSIDQELTRTTKETSLRDTYKRYMALTRIQGHLLTISVALPSGDGTEDYSVRSILSEDLDTISSYANLCRATGVLGDEPLYLAQRVIGEAIQAGLDPDLAQRKLTAFRSGLGDVKSKHSPGIWASFKRFIQRT